jgi:dihydrodipicolinate synthase/N-acetylneuraminate lyase
MEASLYRFLNAVKEPIVVIGVYGDFGEAPHETLHQHRQIILAAVEAVNWGGPLS